MEPFVEELRNLCAAHPTRSKWVFVPSHALGRTLGDRLVLSGTDWANLRFVTPLEIAVRMAAPFLIERGVDPSEDGLGPALVMRLLLELPEERGYFRPLANQPEMAAALWSTMRELRMAGLRASDLKPEHFTSAAKHDELAALLHAYERFLSDRGRADFATVFEEAIRHRDWCPIQDADCWTELPDVVWPPLQRRLLDAMPGERIEPAAFALPGATEPRRLKEARTSRQEPSAAAPLAFLMAPELAPPGDRSALSLFHAGGCEAEVETVVRRILTSGRTLDQVEIICASPQYPALVWEKAMRYEWPITVAQGLPAALTRPGRALLALVDWVEDNFAAGRLRRMLESGDVRLPEHVPMSTGRAARLLIRAQAAWGRETYRLALGRQAKADRTRARRDDLPADDRQRLEARAAEADALAGWIGRLIAGIPAPDEHQRIELQALVDCARAFVADSAARVSALDALAAASLGDALGELRALGDFRCPLDQALRFLRERVESVTVAADRPRPGHLHVSSLGTAGFAGRPLVFVVGLEEGRVFPGAFEDPILLDQERAAISPPLARATDRIDEAVHAALQRLAAVSSMPDGRISLSYSCRDLREYRQTYASWLLLQAYRVISGQPEASYHQLHESLGEARSSVPESASAAPSESRWWLRGVAGAGASARPDVLRRYPALAAGVNAEDARASDAFTEFDGWVPDAGPVLDPCATERVVSPTQLESAAACPFRHFLERGLGVRAIEAGERDRDVWLDPLLSGSLLHDLYARLLRRCRDAGRPVTLPDDDGWVQEQGRDLLAELAVEMPPPSVEVRDRETRLFLDDLALFAEAEASLSASRTPLAFEVSFGRADPADGEPLAQVDPVVIPLGDGLALRLAGRIDRLDRTGAETFEILDYKTGGYWKKDWEGTFAGGSRLQHALYGLAALELLKKVSRKPRVAAAEYYFSSAKGQQRRKRIDTPARATVARVLSDLREVIASGLFVHAPDASACKWCDYGEACGRGAESRAAAKLQDSRLEPFRRLAAHE